MNFSEKLKKAAKELNLTQVQMAGMTGKSKASISSMNDISIFAFNGAIN